MAFDSSTAQNVPGISTVGGGSALTNTQVTGPSSLATISSTGGNEYGAKLTDSINAYIPPAPPTGPNNTGNLNPGSLSNTMTGTTVNPNGNQGAPAGGTTAPPPSTVAPAQSATPAPTNGIAEKGAQYQTTPEQQTMLDNFDATRFQLSNLASTVDQNYNAQISQINAQMGMLKYQQQRENDLYNAGVAQAGYASGMATMTPEILRGQIAGAVSSGIAKLSALTIQQNGLVIAAQKANITQKMDILKQLQEIDTAKFNVAETMKNDFFTNLEKQQKITEANINDNIASIFETTKNLKPEEQAAKLQQYAQDLGVPLSQLQGALSQYNIDYAKPITDARAQMAAQYGIPLTADEARNLTPKEWADRLNSNPLFRATYQAKSAEAAMNSAQAEFYRMALNGGNNATSGTANDPVIASALPAYIASKNPQNPTMMALDRLNVVNQSPQGAAQTMLNGFTGNNTEYKAASQGFALINQLSTSLSQYYKQGGQTNVFSGTVEQVLNKLGTSQNPIASQLATQIPQIATALGIKYDPKTPMSTIFPSMNTTKGLAQTDINNLLNSSYTQLYSQAAGAGSNAKPLLNKALFNTNGDPVVKNGVIYIQATDGKYYPYNQ